MYCPAEEMDTFAIKQFVKEIDDSLPKGNIYHINYTAIFSRTDAYYDHAREIIALLEHNHAEALNNINNVHPSGDTSDPAQNILNIVNSFKTKLREAREQRCVCDYSLDGIGFYLKQDISFIDEKGATFPPLSTIYASDGKIMGTFYLNDSQASLQPATERPPVPGPYWTEIAYLFMTNTISHYFDEMPALSITTSNELIVIKGDAPGQKKELCQFELQIDKNNLKPVKMTFIFYNTRGKLDSKQIKTWQYQDFHGLNFPVLVKEQIYQTNIAGKLNLEEEKTLIVHDFTPGPQSCKDSFRGLLKANYSVYDEITGGHYISGNPEDMLDKLSR
jgi:hypothetical protein